MRAHSPQQKTRRSRRNDPEGVRSRILDCAAKLFQERGYHATSVHDVVKASRISPGALHHHFPTKKSLALGVLSDRVAPVVREAWIDPLRRAPTLERGVTEAFADIVAGIRLRSSVLGCPLNNLALELALSDGDYRKAIDRVFAEWRTVLSERIRQTRGGTHLEPKERAAAANFVISVYSGAMNLAKTSQSAAPLIEAADLLLEWLRARELDS